LGVVTNIPTPKPKKFKIYGSFSLHDKFTHKWSETRYLTAGESLKSTVVEFTPGDLELLWSALEDRSLMEMRGTYLSHPFIKQPGTLSWPAQRSNREADQLTRA
jgi:hypothetical protein